MPSPLATEIYTAHAHVTGGREGAGKTSDGVLDVLLATPGTGKPGTNPEQLFAVGYSACFLSAMHIAALQSKVKWPKDAAIDTDVTLGQTANKEYQLHVVMNIDLPGLDAETKRKLVEAAHATCPYSRATRGDVEVEQGIK
ncbi:organic hydroperoxide resistance protein [Lysobacter sp. KIS68-7]|uniref:organic hydroperoxide resistance protein n=1 Tax=Lysobacter sp. KIS68-7 TaxID=2904252 RepID=UPI001E63E17B|nr:organic hydroperoxide resistance protein [Lysobacter sp. KIS68-7]UHQ19350.1 organic hydroperoxide resistance protein [Lysobacter sp. KIS68-7]